MKYNVKLEATVEAPSAEAAKNVFNEKKGVTYSNLDVMPSKQWAVTVSVPVIYTFDLTVNAETEDEAENIATNEIDFNEIEDLVKTDVVNDYQYDVDTLSVEVQGVEAIEDEDADSAAPGTATEVSAD